MKLKNQAPKGIDPGHGVSSQGAMTSIAGLVVMNDGYQQTHLTA